MRIRDTRLSPFPWVWSANGVISLKAHTISPFRLTLIHNVIIWPLTIVWRLSLVLLFVDFLIVKFGGSSFLPMPQGLLAAILIAGFGFLWVERALRYPFCRFIFGRRILISLTENELFVKVGFFRNVRLPRHQALTFTVGSLDAAYTEVYKHSREIVLVIGNSRFMRLFEVYDLKNAVNIVTNANVAISLAAGASDRDVDPRRR